MCPRALLSRAQLRTAAVYPHFARPAQCRFVSEQQSEPFVVIAAARVGLVFEVSYHLELFAIQDFRCSLDWMGNALLFLPVVKLFRGDAMQEFGTDRNSQVRPNHSSAVSRDFCLAEHFLVLKRREFRPGSSDRWSEIDNDAATISSFYEECRWSAGPNIR